MVRNTAAVGTKPNHCAVMNERVEQPLPDNLSQRQSIAVAIEKLEDEYEKL